ncbi:hypothetical protein Ahy_A09g043179 isoform E [Arachis hypogaea]|uniref:Uncharacterized protein n=1 Tax=Arachis hypogaea TaxID=3818 RepID=A0A445BHQ5_ARAHY|nr:hypothetical protein Ahy_A09g043179 isoform E [Arachis hypogaea]
MDCRNAASLSASHSYFFSFILYSLEDHRRYPPDTSPKPFDPVKVVTCQVNCDMSPPGHFGPHPRWTKRCRIGTRGKTTSYWNQGQNDVVSGRTNSSPLRQRIQTHCKPAPPPQGVAYCRRPSHSKFAIRHQASLVLQVFNPCSLSPIAAASSSSASVVFVCSAALPSAFVCRSRSRLRSRSRSLTVHRFRSRSSPFVHRSRSLAVHRSSSRSSGSHVALLQTLRPTRALHAAVELLSFVAAVSSLNPPPDNTLTPPILCFKLCNF